MNLDSFISSVTGKIPHYFRVVTVWDVLEIILIAIVIYRFLKFIHDTSVERVLKGIIILLIAMPISEILNLNVIYFVLRNTLQIGMLALIILFQPELRRILESLGTSKFTQLFEHSQETDNYKEMIHEVVDACSSMSWSRTGALIVFERTNSLTTLVNASTVVDAKVTAELLKNIFFKNSPLHDGAMVIQKGRIGLAGCVLPVSENEGLPKELGTRHRAGIGISEVSDCVSLMVSEETGSMSVSIKGKIRRGFSPESLEKLLQEELIPKEETTQDIAVQQIKKVKTGLQHVIIPKNAEHSEKTGDADTRDTDSKADSKAEEEAK